jgi:anthranilate synthase component 2
MVAVVDNYDSFTYNLVQYLGELGAEVVVMRNDTVTVEQIAAAKPAHIVVSPGPGRPEDAGITMDVIRTLGETTPVLGVCLGHQAISIAFGGRVERAAAPKHGKTSHVTHEDGGLFQGLAGDIEVGRYHSLVIPPDGVPPGFVVSARAVDDDAIMGIRHDTWPVFGVQFHPESVLTSVGHRILQNFLEQR